jgi:hypothetical protein
LAAIALIVDLGVSESANGLSSLGLVDHKRRSHASVD